MRKKSGRVADMNSSAQAGTSALKRVEGRLDSKPKTVFMSKSDFNKCF